MVWDALGRASDPTMPGLGVGGRESVPQAHAEECYFVEWRKGIGVEIDDRKVNEAVIALL